MGQKAKVWNRGNEEYVEIYKGKEIRIKPGEYIVMARSEAADFIGRWPGYYPKGHPRGGQKIIKMLKREVIEMGKEEVSFICNQCSQIFGSKKALEDHVKDHTPIQEENEPEQEKRPRGRPRKGAVNDTGTMPDNN